MKQSLFVDHDRYSSSAIDLLTETAKALQPILTKYQEMGFSVREIAHVMGWAVNDLEIETVLTEKIK